MDKQVKCLSAHKLKSKTERGEPAKTEIYVFSDGRVDIYRSILSTMSEEKAVGYKVACTKFGKNLLTLSVGFKYDTLMSIASIVNDTIVKHKVKRKDILK